MIVLSTIICFRIPKISFLIYDFLIALICFIADAMSTLLVLCDTKNDFVCGCGR